jgi:hypothetical protein
MYETNKQREGERGSRIRMAFSKQRKNPLPPDEGRTGDCMYALLALTSVKYAKMKNFCSKLISKSVSIVFFQGIEPLTVKLGASLANHNTSKMGTKKRICFYCCLMLQIFRSFKFPTVSPVNLYHQPLVALLDTLSVFFPNLSLGKPISLFSVPQGLEWVVVKKKF